MHSPIFKLLLHERISRELCDAIVKDQAELIGHGTDQVLLYQALDAMLAQDERIRIRSRVCRRRFGSKGRKAKAKMIRERGLATRSNIFDPRISSLIQSEIDAGD
jgi:hypothetical protein